MTAHRESGDPVAWLESLQIFGIKLGLENIRRLLADLGNPHEAVPSIHVAGTNGKGSVCAMLDAIFREAGLRCGLYTSPHLVRFEERIRVSGAPILPEGLREGLGLIRDTCAPWEHAPTFFEVATALAFWWFAPRCDVMVIETGMGGRLDATNVLDPRVAVITPLGMDHAQWLGNSLEEIASEKAGILKPGCPAATAIQPPPALRVLEQAAHAHGSPLHVVDSPWSGALTLEGPHQKWNAALAALAARLSGLPIAERQIADGLRKARWPGRFQRIPPHWILDGAHNPLAADALLAAWKDAFGARRPQVIFGCLRDKDTPAIVSRLQTIAAGFHLVPVGSPRTHDPRDLARHIQGLPVVLHESLSSALEACSQTTEPVLITGSLFLVGEALGILDPQPTNSPAATT